MLDGKSAPWGLRWRSSTLFIISTVGIGLFTDLFLYGLVVPILPFLLQDRVGLPDDEVQSYVSGLLAAYAGASVLFSPPAGVIADRLSTRQLPFLVGLTALLAATIMFAVGQSIPVLIIARILQGVSAAVVWTIGLAMVLDTVGPENLGKTIGSIFGFISIGELLAPVLGGVLYEKAGYGGVFGVGGGILGIDFVMRILLIEKKTAAKYEDASERSADHNPHPDTEGTQEAEESDPTEEDALLSKKEDDKPYEVPPGQPRWIRSFPIAFCLKDPRLLVALLLAFVQATILASFDATIPTEAKSLFQFDSLKGSLLFIALVLPYLLLGPVCGWAVDRYGTKPSATIGFGYLVPALVLLRLPHAGGTGQIALFCVLLALCGLGLAIIGSPSIVESSFVVQRYDQVNPEFFGEQGPYAQLYGINSMVFSAGLTLGPVLGGTLRDKVGYGNANLALAGLCLITSILSFLYVGGRPRILKRRY
ncbi:MAG: hypothetical protein M4579_003709 [Chaenotheca gracillima]|nr:MAG: hypothetical protein M4579_003709 [Chaenotheca gracillima]